MGMTSPEAAGAQMAVDFGGDLLNVVYSWYIYQEQLKENRRVEKLNLKLHREDVARDEKWKKRDWRSTLHGMGLDDKKFKEDVRRWDKEYQHGLDKFEWEKGEADLDREEANERQRYNRIMDYADRYSSMFNRNNQFRSNMQNIWKR